MSVYIGSFRYVVYIYICHMPVLYPLKSIKYRGYMFYLNKGDLGAMTNAVRSVFYAPLYHVLKALKR